MLKSKNQTGSDEVQNHLLFLVAPQSYGLDRLIVEFSVSHTDTRFGRNPLDEGSARRKDLYPKTRNIHKRQISMPPTTTTTTRRDSNPQSQHASGHRPAPYVARPPGSAPLLLILS
jgi:hypothetical protein